MIVQKGKPQRRKNVGSGLWEASSSFAGNQTIQMQASMEAKQSLGGTGDGDSLATYQLMNWASFSRNLSLFMQTTQQLHSRTFSKRIVHGDGNKIYLS